MSALAWAHAGSGDIAACIDALKRCVALRQGGEPVAHADALVQLSRARKLAGDADGAVCDAVIACGILVDGGQGHTVPWLEAQEAHIDALCAAGREGEAEALVPACQALRTQLLPMSPRLSFSTQAHTPR